MRSYLRHKILFDWGPESLPYQSIFTYFGFASTSKFSCVTVIYNLLKNNHFGNSGSGSCRFLKKKKQSQYNRKEHGAFSLNDLGNRSTEIFLARIPF